MPLFTYTATKSGKTVTGSIEASSKEALIAALSKQGIHPLVIKQSSSVKKTKHGKVRSKDLVIFTRQLSTMVSAGVSLTRSLATLQAQSDSKYFSSVIAAIAKDVESGSTLADAFAKHPDVFNDVYVSMVSAGEAGGILDEILKRLAAQVEKDATIRKKIKSAAAYPTVIFSITILAFFGIMIFIIPKIGKILKDLGGPDAKLPSYTQAMLNTSDFLTKPTILQHVPLPVIHSLPNIVIFLAIAIFGTIRLRKYIKTPKGKYKFHAFLLRMPILKTIIVKIAIARFARTFASLMSAGVGVLDALEVTGAAIGNKVIEAELKEAAKQVKNGKQLSEPLTGSRYFPPIVAQMLAVGEETGQIDTILVKVADFYEEEVDAVIDGLSALIEPIMIIVLGAMVGLIAASVMGPISSLSNNVGTDN
jgi:type IV pilus assembly protein PilC